MAWSETLLECSFRGVEFDVRSTADSADRALVEHAYPWVDGADVEDMGRGARAITIEAVFFGDDYEPRLQALLAALDEAGPGELQHPVFGSMPLVQVRRYRVGHQAEGIDQCSVSVDFVESTTSAPFFDRQLASQKADAVAAPGAEAVAAAGDLVADAVAAVRAANPLAALDALRQSMTGPLLDGLAKVSGIVASGLSVLDVPRAWVADIGAIVDGILGLPKFAESLLFDWSGLLGNLKVIDRKVSTGASPMSAGRTPTEAQAVDAVAVFLAVSSATATAEGAAVIFAAETRTPTLSPVEIEAVANVARTEIEAAIVAARAVYSVEPARAITEPLKDQALAVQEAARAIIEARPPLLVRAVPAAGNLRLIAHLFYRDHARAPELWRLNPRLRRPNAIQTGDTLNAYAL